MIPRLLGRFLPGGIADRLKHIIDPALLSAAKRFAPLGHFHIMGHKQMQSRPTRGASHALSLTLEQEEYLSNLIWDTSLEVGLTASHGIAEYSHRLNSILELISTCSFGGQATDYEPTLCHSGEAACKAFRVTVCNAPCYHIFHLLAKYQLLAHFFCQPCKAGAVVRSCLARDHLMCAYILSCTLAQVMTQ